MNVLAQAGGQTSASVLMTALVTLWVVAMFFRMSRAFALTSIATALAMLYVGWSARGWPGVSESDGLILGIWSMWWDSVQAVWSVIYDKVGLDSLAQRIGIDTASLNR
jgi:hypothetical protein